MAVTFSCRQAPVPTLSGWRDVQTVQAIVALVVAVATPVAVYFAALQGHRVAERSAKRASETALRAATVAANTARVSAETAAQASRDAAEMASRTAKASAELASQLAREENERNHFRWACEKIASDCEKDQLIGVEIVRSMVHSGTMPESDLIAAAGVLTAFAAPSLVRLGDDPFSARTVVEPPISRKARPGGDQRSKGAAQ
jgi:hypothetical protein